MTHPVSVSRLTRFTLDSGDRIAAMLDCPAHRLAAGDDVPTGWHFPVIGAATPRSALRPDCFAGLGISLPASPLSRLVAGGRSVEFLRPISAEAELQRTSTIMSFTPKTTAKGPIAIVKIEHSIHLAATSDLLVRETQTYVLLDSPYIEAHQSLSPPDASPILSKTITPDDTLLFQFSALSFNSHKIHLDREYARQCEGYPDLVVNGGITTLLMTEFARTELGANLSGIEVVNMLPLFVNRPITLSAMQVEQGMEILALNEKGQIAARMKVTCHAL